MKRCILLVILALHLVSLTSCSKSEEAQAVDDMIAAIGEITKGSEKRIQEAEEAYEKLEKADKKTVSNYADLQNARTAYDILCAQEVENLIENIGSTPVNSKEDIKAVLDKYDGLTENQKAFVSNYEQLIETKNEYSNMRISEVERKIVAIGNIEFSRDCLTAIRDAREGYDELSTDEQTQVKNFSALTRCENEFAALGVATTERLINTIGEVKYGDECENAIKAAEDAYWLTDVNVRGQIKNYDVLVEAREKYDTLAPVQINSYKLKKGITGKPEISFNITNNSDKIIKSYTVRIFVYDNDNVPVKIYFNDFTQRLTDTDAVKPGKTVNSKGYWRLYGTYSEMKKVVGYVDEVEFYDDTTWSNPEDDSLYSRYSEKILSEDDENILKRG